MRGCSFGESLKDEKERIDTCHDVECTIRNDTRPNKKAPIRSRERLHFIDIALNLDKVLVDSRTWMW